MSIFKKMTKHPYTGRWHAATWYDNFYGENHYGVEFDYIEESGHQNREMFDPHKVVLETREYTEEELKELEKEYPMHQVSTEDKKAADDFQEKIEIIKVIVTVIHKPTNQNVSKECPLPAVRHTAMRIIESRELNADLSEYCVVQTRLTSDRKIHSINVTTL